MATALTAKVLQGDGVRHGFFTRQGGVSTGIYDSLNCGYGSHDDRTAVRENRARVAQALDVAAENLLTIHQVHSPTAVTVTAPWRPAEAPRGDAMVTDRPGVALGVLAADCAPVLFADARAGVIGAAHAGWRGAIGGVLDATLRAMERLGARPQATAAAIGPCIAQGSYEVGSEFHAAFIEAATANASYFLLSDRPQHYRFDLSGYVHDRLAGLGLGRIDRLDLDTYHEEERFFSYRRTTHRDEADYGRQLSAIALAP